MPISLALNAIELNWMHSELKALLRFCWKGTEKVALDLCEKIRKQNEIDHIDNSQLCDKDILRHRSSVYAWVVFKQFRLSIEKHLKSLNTIEILLDNKKKLNIWNSKNDFERIFVFYKKYNSLVVLLKAL